MGTSLSGKRIRDTYPGLIKTTDNASATSSSKELTDGNGNDLNISVNTNGRITANEFVKTSGTSIQILLADGSIITLTNEAAGISSNDNDSNVPTNAAVKDYVDAEISDLIDGSPTALDTLNELAAALGDDANFSTTITNALGNRLRFDAAQSLTPSEISQALSNLGITSTVTEINILDGVTATTAEINKLDGLTATTTELNHTDGVTSNIQTQLDSKVETLSDLSVTASASELNVLDGITSTTDELNHTDGVTGNIQTQLNGLQSIITGGAVTVTDVNLTADRALISNSAGKIAVSPVTADELAVLDGITSTTAEINHTDGVTSNIQTQLDAKVENLSDLSITATATELNKLDGVTATTAEINHVDGVTSNIQTQIDSKQATITGGASTITSSNLTASRAIVSNASGKVEASAITSTEIGHLDGVTSNIQTQIDNLPDSDTTYTVSAVDSGDNAIIRLSGSDATTDDVTLVAGSNITLTPSGDNITIASTASGGGGTGVSWQTTPKTANFTAVAGEGYFVNTTSAEITVTLPASPSGGDEVTIVDYAGTADTNAITITSASQNINANSSDFLIRYERGGVSLVYSDSTQGWVSYNANNETDTALVIDTITADYLVVAGGAAGGMDAGSNYGGAGGAGGLRTSYGSVTGGGGSAETSLTLSTFIDYTVTVGAGGSGQDSDDRGNNGFNSVFATITSTGGGGGGTHNGEGITSGKTGGSGGGGGFVTGGSSGGSAISSPVQGYSGGAGSSSPNASGGGGGAGGNGGTQSSNNGGVGLAVNILNASNAATESVGEISGTDVYYAGGGGGVNQIGDPVATGGLGGGGNGSTYNASNATSGGDNTGGGGGGGTSTLSGRSGGSGVVIVRYPDDYTITETTSPNVLTFTTYTEGDDKVTVFTAGSNGTIQFS